MNPHQFFKLLSDETRLRCVLLLARQGELCVCELVAATEESQPKISRHLATLRSHGLLKDRRQGQWVFYSVSQDHPGWLRNIVEALGNSNCLAETYQADVQRLEQMSERPERCCS
ncbi:MULTISPECIES: metalloregulator ArsR/SmtB family transcription factor [Ferrimonas]|uniref:metalloregulator ArsR/SmtB family transcription factor n=1 Tax=Ferrimonas TaxID=44011 RepID=UPI0004204BED|nr:MULTISPECIES: metalloregulator ArsR/SmtB family transcription factor [Ferrimonas]USD36918.1 metalloregulator ArsR/SmtB family transcription factor [Ferrimonas sp. SCSIO 43195]